MATESRDPHAVEAVLASEEEYQAPPRDDPTQQPQAGDDDAMHGTEDEPAEQQPIDINLLESQRQKPGLQISETIVVNPREKKELTVSGPDEETQPGGPRAVPPGESM